MLNKGKPRTTGGETVTQTELTLKEQIAVWLKARIVKERQRDYPWLENTSWENCNECTKHGWLTEANELVGLLLPAVQAARLTDEELYIATYKDSPGIGELGEEELAHFIKGTGYQIYKRVAEAQLSAVLKVLEGKD